MQDMFLAILFAIVFLVIMLSIEEGWGFIILGFLGLIIGFNLQQIFDISAYGAWANLLQGVYGAMGVSSIAGSIFAGKDFFKQRIGNNK
jgi:hypothetical protein